MADVVGSNGERKDFSVVGKPNIQGRLSYSLASGKAKFGSMVSTRQNMYDLAITQRFAHIKVGFKNDGSITAVQDVSVAAAGVRHSSRFGTTSDMNYGPFFTTKCTNLPFICEAANNNTGKLYVSGQHCPYTWDVMTVAQQRIADKLGMDPPDIATRNIHGPKSQTDNSIPLSYQSCLEAGKKTMNWQWHPAGIRKLPDGRMHGASFRYQMCPRHAFSGYSCTVVVKSDGRVYLPTQRGRAQESLRLMRVRWLLRKKWVRGSRM